MPRNIGIIGHGAFGALLATLVRRFVPSCEVRVYSSRHTPDSQEFFTYEDAAKSDVLLLAVPIQAFEHALASVLPLTRLDTVIVDVATVKMHTVEILKRLAPDRAWVATHPMFGPESYAKKQGDVTDFRIVLSAHTLSEDRIDALKKFLTSCGFDAIEVDADSHDRHLAETLFLTHFIGQVVADAGFTRTEIDTVSFGYLMDAVESVKHDTALFRDVYAYNPYCKEILDRFNVSEEKIRALLEKK
jgi:prephenate dehydrogenase